MGKQLTTPIRTLATLVVVVCWMTSLQPLAAQSRNRSALSQSSDFRPLHHSVKACGKKWLKKARRLTPEQLAWMQRQAHLLFTVTANDQRLLTIEVLSTPSFRNCDVEEEWSRRETTIRVQYYLADGTTQTRLHHFARDETFFNQAPKIYPSAGRALLRGVSVDGTQSNRWLDLKLLGSLLGDTSRWASAGDVALPDAPAAAPTLRLASLRLD